MDLGIKGQVAIITGGASGIGWACARNFAQEGCRVSLLDIAPDVEAHAEQLQKDFGHPAVGHVVDMRDRAAVEAAIAATERDLGPIAHLVHSAATGSGKFGFPFTNLDSTDWNRVLEINIMGMVHIAHAIVPCMIARKSGTMVFIASIAGQIGSQTDPPYSASKAANINFAQCLAKDLAPHAIRVNTVNPGMVKTPLNQRIWQAWNEQQPPERRRSYDDWANEKIRAIAPLGHWQETEDIADMVVFLSSARAAQVTGQAINVDGGQVMHW